MAVGNDSDSSGYSVSITLIVCNLEESEWFLDTSLSIMFVPNKSSLLVLENYIEAW